ncbi:low molecular weight protein-tyrosine-phosphatase [Brevundimonas naejangsanensis]|uniref:low molecular weight protein-tyrosine-phosphatase n=1 Tax=Brevundimonas naejangsanensis TaxID=588932 RepID=UPI000EDD4D93|nr:low molecular weight protein-tyrosine-phosphatase [Brevundimonas naejangsanensis]HAC00342.1 phosphotyrosine protein phosphatase [Brevundimonas sp.]HCW48973.1 phosphotyrosine protein phosphatase [Brevundimonas sp.]
MVPSILFVCLGNICRSPLAEAAFREEARRLKLDAVTDSAGTGNWHIGSPPDPRAQAVALNNGVDISGLRGRQVKPADFRRFTHLVAMDHDNLANLRRIAPPDATAKLSLLLDHVEGRAGQAVADPYYGEDDGFDVTWADVTDGARALAVKLLRHKI